MRVKKAVFVKSSANYKKCPAADIPEYAFIGRSNVGKSTLINMLVNNNKLAKTSKKPGKTQLINHFLVDDSWYLVDLPGYGWARISKEKKDQWTLMTRDYLLRRENLICVFILIDSRLPPQSIDIEFINWMGRARIPFVIVFTKSDKQSKNKTEASVAGYMKKLQEDWSELPTYFITSSVKREGKEELLTFINENNKNYSEIS